MGLYREDEGDRGEQEEKSAQPSPADASQPEATTEVVDRDDALPNGAWPPSVFPLTQEVLLRTEVRSGAFWRELLWASLGEADTALW